MTGRRKPDGKISECNEVKGVALNLTQSPEKPFILGVSRSHHRGRRRYGRCDSERVPTVPPGSKTASSYATAGKYQASDEPGLLGQGAMQYPSMGINVTISTDFHYDTYGNLFLGKLIVFV